MDLFECYSMHPHSGALNFSYFVFEKDNIFLGMVLITLFDLKVVGCSCNLLLRFLLHFNFTLWCYLYKYNFFFTNYSYLEMEICGWVPWHPHSSGVHLTPSFTVFNRIGN